MKSKLRTTILNRIHVQSVRLEAI